MPFNLTYWEYNPYTSNNYNGALYHYTTIESLKSILENKSIRFRKNNFSNDENDGKILGLINNAIINIDNEGKFTDDVFWKLYKALGIEITKSIERFTLTPNIPFERVSFPSMFNFCLSKTYNNHQIWERYKSEVCIEFSEQWLRRALNYPSNTNRIKYFEASSADIIYAVSQQEEILNKIIINSYNDYKDKYDPTNHSKYQEVWQALAADFLFCSYIFKEESEWSAENEYRFFLLYLNDKNSGIEYDPDGNPFIELSFKDNTDIWDAFLIKIWTKNEDIQERLRSAKINSEVMY